MPSDPNTTDKAVEHRGPGHALEPSGREGRKELLSLHPEFTYLAKPLRGLEYPPLEEIDFILLKDFFVRVSSGSRNRNNATFYVEDLNSHVGKPQAGFWAWTLGYIQTDSHLPLQKDTGMVEFWLSDDVSAIFRAPLNLLTDTSEGMARHLLWELALNGHNPISYYFAQLMLLPPGPKPINGVAPVVRNSLAENYSDPDGLFSTNSFVSACCRDLFSVISMPFFGYSGLLTWDYAGQRIIIPAEVGRPENPYLFWFFVCRYFLVMKIKKISFKDLCAGTHVQRIFRFTVKDLLFYRKWIWAYTCLTPNKAQKDPDLQPQGHSLILPSKLPTEAFSLELNEAVSPLTTFKELAPLVWADKSEVSL